MVVLASLCPIGPVAGQTQSVQSPSAEAYRDAIQSRGIQSDIDYGSGDVVSLPVEQDSPIEQPDTGPEPVTADRTEVARWIVITAVAAVLVFILALFVRNGAGVGVAFGSGTKDLSARGREATVAKAPNKPAPMAPGEAFLQELAAMADRREALHRLLVRLLAQSAFITGLRPGRSWTARDLIRSVPEEWPHLPALREISGLAEVVWFGGRDVDRDVFEDCLDRARPIVLATGAT